MKPEDQEWMYLNCGILLVIILSLFVIDVGVPFISQAPLLGKASYANVGCCTLTCQTTSEAVCPDNFVAGKGCEELSQCSLGCCVDESYCYENYLRGSCQSRFVENSCINHPMCVSEQDSSSFVSGTGFPLIYDQDKFLWSEPSSGKTGMPFQIKAIMLNDYNKSYLKVNFSAPDYQDEVYLFDDSLHGDNNLGDGIYAGIWEEELNISETTTVNFYIETNVTSSLILTPTNCIPIIETESSRNIIFYGTQSQDVTSNFHTKAGELSSTIFALGINLSTQDNLSSDNLFNYYFIQKEISSSDQSVSNILEECSMYQQKDYVIHLKDTVSCNQVGNFIEVPNDFFFTTRILESNMSQLEFLDSFCQHVSTEIEYRERMRASLTPPKIEIHEIDEGYPDEQNITILFSINDNKDEKINYTIYADLDHPIMYLSQGEVENDTATELSFKVPDGQNTILIEAEDSEGNIAVSEAIEIEKSVNNFVIEITSLEEIAYLESPELEYIIYHKNPDEDIDFMVYVDSEGIIAGRIKPLQEQFTSLDLREGEHTIYIAEDINF